MKGYIICDLQFGSTGKGLIAGYLAKRRRPDTVVTAWSPNAGHTFIDSNGKKFVHTMLANGVVSPDLERIMIGPGSVLDIDKLIEELKNAIEHVHGKMLYIHPNAAILMPKHKESEASLVAIGSTMKGSMAATIQKMSRSNDDSNIAKNVVWKHHELKKCLESMGIALVCDYGGYYRGLGFSKLMQIEGAQGFSLSIHHGMWPYTTSRDCTPAQIISDCGLSYGRYEVIGTARTFPIRVANRFDDTGQMIGTSGPCYQDQREISWSDLGLEPELTTVTKLPRRVFTFSKRQIIHAMTVCRPDKVFLNFCNYTIKTDIPHISRSEIVDLIDDFGSRVCVLGFGPTENDLEETDFRI